jgi:3-vinyl bacteriochlorophyllide hydratase
MDACPWSTMAGRRASPPSGARTAKAANRKQGLYSPEERRRRDSSPWTFVQGVLAPVQFVIFLISLYLVLSYLATGEGFWLATASVVVKTLVLYTIMVTGAIWEREVFGRYLFAPAFFWEDVFSILVLALHTGYLVTLFSGTLDPVGQMYLALLAYATYVINAGQFLLKLRAARLQGVRDSSEFSAG